jgi:hypothetical protein
MCGAKGKYFRFLFTQFLAVAKFFEKEKCGKASLHYFSLYKASKQASMQA